MKAAGADVGYHFFVEIDGGQWHRTETKGEPGGDPVRCSCGISAQNAHVLKLRSSDDDSWQWVPDRALGKCFPESMRNPGGKRVVGPWPPTARETLESRRPADHGGVPMCSHLVCPRYSPYKGTCKDNNNSEVKMGGDVCIPAVREMAEKLSDHELREKLRAAEAVRDDARAASQRDLDERRKVDTDNQYFAALLAAQEKRVCAMRSELAAAKQKAAYPPSCRICKDKGVIDTGNNDLPCECEAGDHAMFNTVRGLETGAQIKARR